MDLECALETLRHLWSSCIMSITVDVHLISGKTVSLETETDVCLDDLKQRAQVALGVGKGRLLTFLGKHWMAQSH